MGEVVCDYRNGEELLIVIFLDSRLYLLLFLLYKNIFNFKIEIVENSYYIFFFFGLILDSDDRFVLLN